jgi:putative ABC transport system substrate-binding protein
MIDCRAFIHAVALGVLLAPLVSTAQQPEKIPRIGYLWSGPPGSDPTETRGLRHGLRELGWVEGQNIAIEYRYAENDLDQIPRLIADLISLKIAVLVTPGTPVTAAAKRVAGITPIVSVSNDPVGSGFVQSLAHPGGTITGLSFGADAGFSGNWLELVRETAPKTSRVGIIWNPKFELVVNLKTAKAPGLTIPQSLLLRADEIIR